MSDFLAKEIITSSIPSLCTLLPLPYFLNVKKGADLRQAIHYQSVTKKIKLIN